MDPRFIRTGGIGLAVGVVLACGGGGQSGVDPAAVTYACDERAPSSTCIEYGALEGAALSSFRGHCVSEGQGTWLTNEPCPTADRLGVCAWPEGSVQHFYAGCSSCTGIQDLCTSRGGTWTPLP